MVFVDEGCAGESQATVMVSGMTETSRLIEAEDIAGLLRVVDAGVDSGDWERLVALARACRAAVERGRQLWSVATHISYRIALDAPPAFVAPVLSEPVSRFTFGPLTEVAAQNHDWESLAGLVADGPVAAALAQERILRGEDLRGDERAYPHVFELPLQRAPGEEEVGHLFPTYSASEVHVPDPPAPWAGVAGPGIRPAHAVTEGGVEVGHLSPEHELSRVWQDHFQVWTTQSGAELRTFAAEIGVHDAIAETVEPGAAATPIEPGAALVRLEWAASTGAAHGRRPGFAAGRFNGWWTASRLAGVDWPQPDPEAFMAGLGACEWIWFEPVPRPSGWVFGLAVGRPDGKATACLAVDWDAERAK